MPHPGRPTRRQFVAGATALASGLIAPGSHAQGAKYPSKQIRIVVPFAPGGLTDAYARLYGEQLTQQLGATVLVENKTGAGAVIGIDAVAKAPADGYTLLVTTTGTVMQNRVLYTKLPYNLDKDLVPITVFPSGPLVVAVAPNVPARNVKEFLAWAKGREASMGSYAPGSYPQMLADLFNRHYGSKLQTVNYRGETPMWVDVASGQVSNDIVVPAAGSVKIDVSSSDAFDPIFTVGSTTSTNNLLVQQGVYTIFILDGCAVLALGGPGGGFAIASRGRLRPGLLAEDRVKTGNHENRDRRQDDKVNTQDNLQAFRREKARALFPV